MLDSGTMVIVRGFGSGVHAGELLDRDPRNPGVITLGKSRRFWSWGAYNEKVVTCSEAARVGPNKHSRIGVEVPLIILMDGMECIEMENVAVSMMNEQGWEGEPVVPNNFIPAPTGDPKFDQSPLDGVVGRYCLVRTHDAGLFVAKVEEWDHATALWGVFSDAMRILEWGSLGTRDKIWSLGELAMFGVGTNSKIAKPVANMELHNIIELTPMTAIALERVRACSNSK